MLLGQDTPHQEKIPARHVYKGLQRGQPLIMMCWCLLKGSAGTLALQSLEPEPGIHHQ